MLINAKTLNGCKLDSRDGEIGKVKEFYFDDRHWTIRYLIADTGSWLASRQVLIAPSALGAIRLEERLVSVELTKKQIENSPSLNTDKPVSRQYEEDYYGYYGWPTYWDGPNRWGAYPYLVRDPNQWDKATKRTRAWDPELRSTRAVTGYHIQADDGEIGHVEDFVIDDETWAIRYLVVATRNWWPGKKVLISPQWINRVSWGESKVFINLSRETIKQSPEYTEDSLVSRDYEVDLYGHYNQKGYWTEELVTH